MRRCSACAIAVLLLGTSLSGFAKQPSNGIAVATSDAGWIRLFDGKSFDGWYTRLQKQKKNEDPAKIFQIEDGMIHVYNDQAEGSEVPSGYLATDSEYAYYHLRLEYKWGSKRFRPRAMQRRDAGVLYHVLPPDAVWPRSIECQIQENDVGDCYTVRGAQVAISGEVVDRAKKIYRYKPEAEGGVPLTVGDGTINRVIKSNTQEHDGWNTVEVIVRGSEGSEHIVNGHAVFRAKDLRQLAPSPQPSATGAGTSVASAPDKKWVPLAHGRIAIQAEYAEVFYRNIEIRPIPEGPLESKAK